MALFENYERRVDKINSVLAQYGISSIEECKEITLAKGIDCDKIVRGTQPICFENAIWAYTVGCAIAIKSGAVKAADAAAAIGIGLQSFCIPGSVAENRKVGLGHGNLGKMLLSEETECFCFLAGHESFAAAEGAIKIALNANKVRTKPLRVILNGLGKDAAMIISRINGFTYCKTEFDPYTETVTVTEQKAYSNGPRADVKCYGADNVPEGVAIMKLENVGVSITGNSTNPTRFQHPVAGTYKKWAVENGVKYIVDVEEGQKTGFFLDQKYNRLSIHKICQGMDVLDCFTHTGSFALNAGIAGAKSVLGIDASQLAVDQATENAKLNGLQEVVKFQCEDVFALLPRLEAEGRKFDVIILDPPAFTKSRSSVKNAVKGYREINLRAMKLLKDGGFLATCSCSHFMTYELFTQTIGQAAKNVHKRLRQVEYRHQAPDHPILWAAEESYYLKFYIFQVMNQP